MIREKYWACKNQQVTADGGIDVYSSQLSLPVLAIRGSWELHINLLALGDVDKLEAVPALHGVAGVLSVQVQAIAIGQVTSAIVGPVQRGI